MPNLEEIIYKVLRSAQGLRIICVVNAIGAIVMIVAGGILASKRDTNGLGVAIIGFAAVNGFVGIVVPLALARFLVLSSYVASDVHAIRENSKPVP